MERSQMAEEEEEEGICTVCQSPLKGEQKLFHQAPVCPTCWKELGLDSMSPDMTDEWLKSNIHQSAEDVMKGFMALTCQYPKHYGWNILAVINTIGDTVEDPQQRSILEQSAILSGAAVLRNGAEEGDEPDPRMLSLLLVLGQFLVLSVMRRIVEEKDLRTRNILDETLLIGAFNRKMFNMLKEIDPGKDEKLENVLAGALSRVV